MTLTDKQKRFVSEYLIDLNATQAAIRAGYSEKTARQQGARMLSNVNIKKAIEECQNKIADKNEGLRERIKDELIKIGFSDIRNISIWNNGHISLIPSNEIDENISAAISEVTSTTAGVKVKMYDKQAALMNLAKLCGFVTDKQEITGSDGGAIQQSIRFTFVDSGKNNDDQ